MPTTKQLSLEFEDSGEFIVVQRAATQTLERHRQGPLWWRVIYWLGFCPARPQEKYKKNIAQREEELPPEVKMTYVLAVSVRSGKDPEPEKVSSLLEWHREEASYERYERRVTDALFLF